jgi:Flp pilus assembly protein TadG
MTIKGQTRRGAMAVELMFVLPVLLAFLFGTVEFSMLLLARQQLLVASREGARVAALGGSSADVEQNTRLFLGTGSLSQATVEVILTDAEGQPVMTGGPVAVTVSLPATQAAPDLLAFLGFSLQQETILAQTVMRKE